MKMRHWDQSLINQTEACFQHRSHQCRYEILVYLRLLMQSLFYKEASRTNVDPALYEGSLYFCHSFWGRLQRAITSHYYSIRIAPLGGGSPWTGLCAWWTDFWRCTRCSSFSPVVSVWPQGQTEKSEAPAANVPANHFCRNFCWNLLKLLARISF